ncbi:cytokine receptor-like isoform X2 [Eurosta solidaginis]|uniref:cytokine receptor-like isoform X2 n=1 Tax=Eurosta solidaginis TaxID=178769 RepID=UPI003530DCC3
MLSACIINATTIVYTLQNASEQDTSYTCKSGQYAIANTDVIVGTKPTKVTDFTCEAYDFIYMTCSFTIPANTVPTTYNLKYVTQNANYILNCTKLVKEGDRATCNFTLDDGSYKPNFEFYSFRLTSNNSLGSLSQNLSINHKVIVKPAISEFRVIDISAHSCALTWQMERYSSYKLHRMQMEVHLRSPHYENTKTHYCIKCNNHAIFNLQIHDLPYAYYEYNVSLRIKMKMSAATWSDSYTIVFQTLPSAPQFPPAVDTSSFYLNATHLRLFWYPMPEYHRNGSNFHYIVKHYIKDDVVIDQPSRHTQIPTVAYPWEGSHSYEFQLWSSNEKGVSPISSRIRVPELMQNSENRTPSSIRSVYHALKRSYTLLWSPPEDYTNLEGYTIFWCKPKSVVSNECLNIMDLIHLNKDARNFTIQQSQPLVLAVAANYADYYTGMHWAKCTADASNDLEKLEPNIIGQNSYSVLLRWRSERVCTSLIKGYTIIYCKTKSITKLKCLDKNVTIYIDKSEDKYEILDLEPNTPYKMQMYMYSDVKSGPISEALTLQTNEAASTPPQNLTADHITSQSVSLTWLSPYKTNGKVRSYIISYNSERHVVPCNKTNNTHDYGNVKKNERLGAERLRYTLSNLSSFTNYTICVKAFTVAESIPSNCVHTQTLIGVPSSPTQARFEDANDIVIHWLQPEVPSGRVDYYEVVVETKLKDNIEERHISRITNNGMTCTIRKPSCDNNNYKYTIGIRAVNVAYAKEIDQNLIRVYNSSHSHENYVTAATHELGCIEADSKAYGAVGNHIKNDFIEYRSFQVIVFNYVCGAIMKSDGKVWITMFVVMLGTTIIVIGVLLIFKRLHEMASINCKIPEPLNDLVNGINGKEFMEHDDEYLKDTKIKQQYKSSENGRLLPCISNVENYAQDRTWADTKNSYYATTDDTTNDYCIQDPMTMPNGPEKNGYMAMKATNNDLNDKEMQKNSVKRMLSYTKMENGYVRPNELQSNEREKPFTINWPLQAADGYINPNNRHTFNWQEEMNYIQNDQANVNSTVYMPSVT